MASRVRSSTIAFLVVAMLSALSQANAQSSVFTVNTTGDSNDALPGNGLCADAGGSCSLRAAIMEANGSTSVAGDRIDLPSGRFTLTLGFLTVTGPMNIRGAGSAGIIIEGDNASGVGIFVLSPETGSVRYTRKIDQGTDTVTRRLVPKAGATTTASFVNCLEVEGCMGKDGNVDVTGGNLHPISFDFSVSPAELAAVSGFPGKVVLTVEGSRDIGHKVGAPADVVEATLDGSSLGHLFRETIDTCPPGENIRLDCGPNFHNDFIGRSSLVFRDTVFQTAAADGSMDVVLSPVFGPGREGVGRIKIFSVQLRYVTAAVKLSGISLQGESNAAIFNSGASVEGSDLVVRNNSAPTSLAGIWNQSGRMALRESTIAGNTGLAAGGIYNSADGVVSLERCTVSGNKTTHGAGGGIVNSGSLALVNTTVSGNLAKLGGGGIQNLGILKINFSTISNNSANFDLGSNFDPAAVGGGIANLPPGRVVMANSILAGNRDGRDTGLPFPPNLVSPIVSTARRPLLTTSYRSKTTSWASSTPTAI